MALVKPHELKYEWTVSEEMLIVRAYRATFGNDTPLTFCRLFWGTILNLFLAIVFLALSPLLLVAFGCATAKDHFEAKAKAKPLTPEVIKPPKVKKPPAPWRVELLDKVSYAGARTVYVITYVGKPIMRPIGKGFKASGRAIGTGLEYTGHGAVRSYRWVAAKRLFWKVVGVIGTIVCGAIVVVAAGVLVFALIQMLIVLVTHIWIVLLEVVGAILIGVAAFGIMMLATRKAVERDYHRTFGHYAAAPALTSWGLFVLAYKAVKTNTCPRLNVVAKNEVPRGNRKFTPTSNHGLETGEIHYEQQSGTLWQ